MRLTAWLPLGAVAEIAPLELHRRMAAGDFLQILDVRSHLEYRRGHLSGARNAPIPTLHSALLGLDLDPRRPVIAICLSAHRSIPAVRLLRERGFAEAAQLQGGMIAWWRAGLPTVNGEDASP